jgi:hypothetical protein
VRINANAISGTGENKVVESVRTAFRIGENKWVSPTIPKVNPARTHVFILFSPARPLRNKFWDGRADATARSMMGWPTRWCGTITRFGYILCDAIGARSTFELAHLPSDNTGHFADALGRIPMLDIARKDARTQRTTADYFFGIGRKMTSAFQQSRSDDIRQPGTRVPGLLHTNAPRVAKRRHLSNCDRTTGLNSCRRFATPASNWEPPPRTPSGAIKFHRFAVQIGLPCRLRIFARNLANLLNWMAGQDGSGDPGPFQTSQNQSMNVTGGGLVFEVDRQLPPARYRLRSGTDARTNRRGR